MPNTPAPVMDPALSQRRLITGVLMLPLFFLIFLPGMFIGALHSPTPDGLRVAVIGDTPQANTVVGRLAVAAEGFDVRRLPDVDIAAEQLRGLDLRAAYDPVTGDLYIASAGGTQSATAAETLFSSVARSLGTPVEVHDVAPLPSADRLGTSALYIGIGAIVGGFLSGLIVCMIAARLPIGWQVLTVSVMSVVVAGIETLYGWVIFDIFSDNASASTALLAGLALVSGLVTLAGMRLIGPAMIMLSLLVLVFGGVTASGLTVPLDLAPEFYRWIHEILPTARGLSALRAIVYFDGHGIAADLAVMAVWGIAALALLGVLRNRSEVPGMAALQNAEVDEAVVAVGAAAATSA
ncbi:MULTISPECIES: DUF3533 domain-containing protein [Nocardia]|uniref:DUF3533 domain-containing protein n=1 Tax=Nocardia TaxID=1817 RepID=UPI00130084B4|nr:MULTISPECIES: DUF3533 domain-containing protein [Nocardia]